MIHSSINLDRTGFHQDANLVFSIHRLKEMAKRGEMGLMADCHHPFMSIGRPPEMMEELPKQLGGLLKEDDANGVVLSPVWTTALVKKEEFQLAASASPPNTRGKSTRFVSVPNLNEIVRFVDDRADWPPAPEPGPEMHLSELIRLSIDGYIEVAQEQPGEKVFSRLTNDSGPRQWVPTCLQRRLSFCQTTKITLSL